MTSSAFTSLNNKTSMISSLPSPPSSLQKTPTFMVDRAPSFYYRDRSGSVSDTLRSSSRDIAELRPFLLNHPTDYYLPPIQHVIHTPTASPSLPFESYSSISSVASSPTPLDEEEEDEERQKQQFMIRRKGSIASLLNSDPELRQLDEEESKCNYQSHFIDNNKQPSLKRGRPRQDHIELIYNKKQCLYTNTNAVQITSTHQDQSNSIQPVHVELLSTRATKGLRHFSKQVCDKVAEKGQTTYNEVADELAFDIQNSIGNDVSHFFFFFSRSFILQLMISLF